MVEKLENIGFGGCQKLKYEMNTQKKNGGFLVLRITK